MSAFDPKQTSTVPDQIVTMLLVHVMSSWSKRIRAFPDTHSLNGDNLSLSVRIIRWIVWTFVCFAASLTVGAASIAAPLPRSILVLNESEMIGPFYRNAYDALRSTVTDNSSQPVSIYLEQLDLERFGSVQHEKSLKTHFESKYIDKPIGVIVALGFGALDFVLRLRTEMFAGVPVVFAMVDAVTLQHLNIPPDVTGLTSTVRFQDFLNTARIVVPDLQRIAIVGDRWEKQTAYRHLQEEIPVTSAALGIIDLVGLPMRELKKRVAVLPERTAIAYTSIFSDGEGTSYPPIDALRIFAGVANRPIVGAAETFVGAGAVGGYVLMPATIGKGAGDLALRILDGESVSAIPIADGNVVGPIFDWRQMQRWGVSASRLPAGSEIRFRDPTAWEQYKAQILLITAAILTQALLIAWLLHERQYRRRAETTARETFSELEQMNRIATAGELSAAITHEIKQPITGMVAMANAAVRWLSRENPDIDRARDAMNKVVAAGRHASDVITNVRGLFGKDTQEKTPCDVNKLIRTVLALVYIDLRKHSIESQVNLSGQLPPVLGNEIQLQQVILNLVMNAIESMVSAAEPRELSITSETKEHNTVHVSIADTGSGIDLANLSRIFKPMFTTKARGMGMGLAICKSIIESHNGRIWVSAGAPRGSIFHFELPVQRGGESKSNVSDPTPATLKGSPASAAAAPSLADEMME
jgi:signal transduction histidine kinase